MSIDRELEALAARRSGNGEKVRRWAQRMILKRHRHRAYAMVFCDASGNVSEAGQAVIADLAQFAGLGMAGMRLSDADLRALEGRRAVVLRLIDSLYLDDAKLARMARQFREMQDE